jgi:hypothetical protein
MDVSALSWANSLRTNDGFTYGEIVWFWHPGADAKSAVMIR